MWRRLVYSALWFIAMPILFARLWWKGRHIPAYRTLWKERLGYYPFRLQKPIWVHAVSVGETIAIAPLLERLLNDWPSHTVLVTMMTPTGRAHVKRLFGDRVKIAYLPYDTMGAVTRFLDAMSPLFGLIVETEIWPNLFSACKKQGIPLYLMNARLSEKSFRGYFASLPWFRDAFNALQTIAVQTEKEALRFSQLGVPRSHLQVTGSLKFDRMPPSDLAPRAMALRNVFGETRPIWIAASTHAGEEKIVLAAHRLILRAMPDALLLLVPKHPSRFEEVFALASPEYKLVRYSDGSYKTGAASAELFLGDAIGELMYWYAASDMAFVGGSLIDKGGHNLLEPASLGIAPISGPSLYNFTEISELLRREDALHIVQDAVSLAEVVLHGLLTREDREASGARAKAVWQSHQGALTRQYALVHAGLERCVAE